MSQGQAGIPVFSNPVYKISKKIHVGLKGLLKEPGHPCKLDQACIHKFIYMYCSCFSLKFQPLGFISNVSYFLKNLDGRKRSAEKEKRKGAIHV